MKLASCEGSSGTLKGQHSSTERLKPVLVVALSATFIAFIYSVRNVIGTVSAGRAIDWGWTVGYEFLYWYIWQRSLH